MNKDIKVFTGENLPEPKIPVQGQNMMQIRSQYIAAMHVPIPRDEEKIIAKIEKVARYVGHDFFYLWPVSAKDEKKVEMISGGTIDLAETLLYYWTNIAIEHDIEDLGDKWKIKHTFIDFERGMQQPRTTIVYKPKNPPGGWSKERWERMKLNTAFSYNKRDLVFTVIPRWMKNKIIAVAKTAELEKATEELKKGDAANFFIQIKKDYGISQEDMLSFIGETELNNNSYFKVKNIFAQLERGDMKAKDIKESIPEKSRKPEAKKKKEPKKEKKEEPQKALAKEEPGIEESSTTETEKEGTLVDAEWPDSETEARKAAIEDGIDKDYRDATALSVLQSQIINTQSPVKIAAFKKLRWTRHEPDWIPETVSGCKLLVDAINQIYQTNAPEGEGIRYEKNNCSKS